MIDWRQHITSDPDICQGQLCAAGTRVLVTNILDSLAEGATSEEILTSFPGLKPVHITAAIAYAAELAREEEPDPTAPKLRIKLDENLPSELVADIQAMGYEAETVTEEGLSGHPDPTIIQQAKDEGAVLLTLDKGIGDVRIYPPEFSPGIVLLRPSSDGRGEILEFARRNLATILGIELSGKLAVVNDRGVRVR